MATCYYTCNLLPPDLLARAGHRPRRLISPGAGPKPTTPAAPRAIDAIVVHPSTCPYVVTLVSAGEQALAERPQSSLVVPAGCDAMRRLGDALAARYPSRVFTLFVPRTPDPASVHSLARDLERLDAWLAERAGSDPTMQPDVAADIAVADNEPISPGTFSYPTAPVPGGAFIVAGPLSDPGLLSFIESLGLHISGVETCSGPERTAVLDGVGGLHMDLQAAAESILKGVSCPRSSAPDRRAYLARRIEESGAKAVIYARLPFCDPSAYDTFAVERLAGESGLPYLEVEVGFPFEVTGPLRVRIEAFLETLLLATELSELDELADLEVFD